MKQLMWVVLLMVLGVSAHAEYQDRVKVLDSKRLRVEPAVCTEVYAAGVYIGKEYLDDFKVSSRLNQDEFADALAWSVIQPMFAKDFVVTDQAANRFTAILFMRHRFAEFVTILSEKYKTDGNDLSGATFAATYLKKACEKTRSFTVAPLYIRKSI